MTGLTSLFAVTLFTSSALVFIVEPMFGKLVLPLLGGSPSVWNTCVVFFQTMLLAAYAYSHLLSTRFPLSTQIAVQLTLIAVVSLALPVGLPDGFVPPPNGSPVTWLLLALLAGVGGPLFVLFTTAPLLQRWFSCTSVPAAGDPYFLYAASNVGSILALLAYPLLVEPGSTLPAQRQIWTFGYGLFGVLTVWCALSAWRLRRREPGAPAQPADLPRASITWRRRALWTTLSAVPSSLMLGVTTYVSTDVAAVPLLWTVPLALYLGSFVLSFSRREWLPVHLVRGAASVLLMLTVLAMALGVTRPAWLLVPLHVCAFFALAVLLHCRLAADRPNPAGLTEFYLWMSAGGVIGGLFNSLVAPVLFTSVVEYPLAVAAAAWLFGMPSRPEQLTGIVRVAAPITAGLATGMMVLTATMPDGVPALTAFALGLAIFGYLLSTGGIWQRGTAVSLMLLLGIWAQPDAGTLLQATRTFFGVHRVWHVPEHGQHRISHGTTVHGTQQLDEERRRDPVGYYHRTGPIGQVFTHLHAAGSTDRVGVIGLGAGGLAAYARPGEQWTFFEIDPAVEQIARNPRFFTYLSDCGARCEVVIGDARLSLAARTASRFRLLILDAFSSDAIPVHLLTREALQAYLPHVEAGGLIALHVSNRHLDLLPVVAALARDGGLRAARRFDTSRSPDGAVLPSQWVVLAREPEGLHGLVEQAGWTILDAAPGVRAWTDDYSNLLSVLKRS